ncbi:MAG: mechanosensitive ion channel protein MscS [Blastopirellula sp.]|nr:MAG: mechanosensitive ion channel protein MscS [Blastopirellula sp.]
MDWDLFFQQVMPTFVIIFVFLALLIGINWMLFPRGSLVTTGSSRFPYRRVIILSLSALCVIFLTLMILPDSSSENADEKGDSLRLMVGFIGLLLTTAAALASTSFVSNLMAGLLLRLFRNFRLGDFIEVGDQIGRVSDTGLFHTEIQTEDSDLVTLPNFFLVSQPVKVVRSSGTIISATVSLGYDVPHPQVSLALGRAAEQAGLDHAFTQILELGDYSIVYRIAGHLEDVKNLISAKSRLREKMLDALHVERIEIVSPTFMNQRQIGEREFIPQVGEKVSTPEDATKRTPDELVFTKALLADRAESLKKSCARLETEINEAKVSEKNEEGETKQSITKEMLLKWYQRELDQSMAELSEFVDKEDN